MKPLAARMLRVLATVAACVLATTVAAQAAKPLPLPDLRGPVTLRVAYVHNPRLPALPSERLGSILSSASAHLKNHFGLAIAFAPPVEVPIIKLFAALPPRLAALAESQRLDPPVNGYGLDRLAKSLLGDLAREGDLAAQKRFAASYLVEPPKDNSDLAFARALVKTQHALLQTWRGLKGADGQPLVGMDRYNEYAYWNLLGSTQLPYEVLVTNQLIASAEWEGNSVHSALRGGVSNGVTTESRAGRWQLMSVLSTFPFLDESPQTVLLRGGDIPSVADADNYMALLLAHELGHQLLHLGHPFGNTACLMTPPVVLKFREWAAGLSPARCPLRSSAANTPGSVNFARPEVAFK